MLRAPAVDDSTTLPIGKISLRVLLARREPFLEGRVVDHEVLRGLELLREGLALAPAFLYLVHHMLAEQGDVGCVVAADEEPRLERVLDALEHHLLSLHVGVLGYDLQLMEVGDEVGLRLLRGDVGALVSDIGEFCFSGFACA